MKPLEIDVTYSREISKKLFDKYNEFINSNEIERLFYKEHKSEQHNHQQAYSMLVSLETHAIYFQSNFK